MPPVTSPRLLAGALTAALAVLVSGCGPDLSVPQAPQPAPADSTYAVIVAGSHANSPAPHLSSKVEDVITKVLRVNGTVEVITDSGQPTLLSDKELRLRRVRGTTSGQESIVKANLDQIDHALQSSPKADGADPWGAIHQAAGAIQSGGGRHPVLVVADSGLSDRGVLDFTAEGMLGAEPKELVSYLRSINALPKLGGVTVYLQGIGYTTAPQAPLSPGQRTRLIDMYRAALKAAGATVVVDGTPRAGDPVPTAGYVVSPVPIPSEPAPQLCTSTEMVFTSQSAVSFNGDLSTFVDESAAHAALEPVAQWLTAKPSRTARIRGTTANARSLSWQKRLGLDRAERVKAFLVSRGVRPSQVTTVGVGSDFPEYVRPDRDARGRLLPGPASVNRSVRIATVDPC